MRLRRLVVAFCLAAAATAAPTAQSDLDTLMSRVLSRRDDNWKKLQQYTLNERETLQITALVVFRLFGFQREYLWFPREGFFVRSPLKADGVEISEEQRRREEDRWLRQSQNREKRAAARAKQEPDAAPEERSDDASATRLPGDVALTVAVEDVILQTFEPQFIRSANFLRFKFDQGQYALSGRERMLDRDVLRIEYYPKLLFKEERRQGVPADKEERRQGVPGDNETRANRPCERQGRPDRCDKEEEFEEDLESHMNKVSLVTLWVDPAEAQILRYEFRIMDMDFLPGRKIVRVEGVRASMRMGEPFPNVWLPSAMEMRFRMSSAAGPLEARYDIRYSDYRLPTVTGRVR